jgi:hypothetical protein
VVNGESFSRWIILGVKKPNRSPTPPPYTSHRVVVSDLTQSMRHDSAAAQPNKGNKGNNPTHSDVSGSEGKFSRCPTTRSL